jgi:hypothetical protein
VNLSECVFGFRSHALNTGQIAHIELKRESAASQPTYLCLEFPERLTAAAGQNQIGPGSRERARNVLAKTAAGPGHQSNLP